MPLRRGRNTFTGAFTARSVVCVVSDRAKNILRMSVIPCVEESTAVNWPVPCNASTSWTISTSEPEPMVITEVLRIMHASVCSSCA